MRSPGDEGLLAALQNIIFLPPELGVPFLHDLYERQIDRGAFQLALAVMWRQGAYIMRDVAGSREQLRAWFQYADFRDVRLPRLRDWCGLHLLPERFTAWRGGCGFEQDIAAGWSWTLRRPVAAVFVGIHRQFRRPGKVHFLRREVRREEALAYFDHFDREVVLAEPGAYEAEAVELEELMEMGRPAALEINARLVVGREKLALFDAEADPVGHLHAAAIHKARTGDRLVA